MEDHREARRQHRGISGNSDTWLLLPSKQEKGALTLNFDDEKEEKMKIEAEEFSTLFKQRDPT